MVVFFQTRAQPLQHGQRIRSGRLPDHDRTKPTLQRRILFDVFSIFFQRCGADNLNFSPSQRRFQQVCRIDGAFRGTGAHQGVHFVHKENHVSAPANLREDVPDPFFKLTTVFRPRQHTGHVQAQQPLALQQLRHLSRRDPLGQSLYNGGLPHARLPDQGWIIFVFPAEYAHHCLQFRFPTDDRVRFGRPLYHVLAKLLQQPHTHTPFPWMAAAIHQTHIQICKQNVQRRSIVP